LRKAACPDLRVITGGFTRLATVNGKARAKSSSTRRRAPN
jgi:hypothetical protein